MLLVQGSRKDEFLRTGPQSQVQMTGRQGQTVQPKSGICAALITTKDQYHMATRVPVAMSQVVYLVPHEDPWPIPAEEVLPDSSGYLISGSAWHLLLSALC